VQTQRRDHDRSPDVLIDRGHRRAVHRALREAATGGRAAPKQVGIAVAISHRPQRIVADQSARERRYPYCIGFGFRPRPLNGHIRVTEQVAERFTASRRRFSPATKFAGLSP